MGRNKKYGEITLTDGDRTKLEKIASSQTEEYRKTKQCLKDIRVESKEELSDRIYKYMEQVNESPVVYH